jgi:ankyrin repeat protein
MKKLTLNIAVWTLAVGINFAITDIGSANTDSPPPPRLKSDAVSENLSSTTHERERADYPSGRVVVSILWFENKADAGAEHWRYYLAGSLKKAMKQVQTIRLRTDGVGYARRELGFSKGSALTEEQARKIGEIIEAQWVIWGSYQDSGNRWQVTAFLLNVASSDVSGPITASGTDWFDLRDVLTRKILEQLKIKPSEEERVKILRRETHLLQALEWRVKAHAYQADGEPYSLQEEATRRAIAADEHYAEAYMDLGAELASQGKFDEAESTLQRAVEINPDLASAHLALGAIHLLNNQDEQALRELQEALHLDPENAGTLVRLSELHAAKGQWEQATTYAEEAVQLAPLDASLHAHLGLIYVHRLERKQAMRELKEAERLADPDTLGDLNTLQSISQSYHLLGEIPLAVKHYEELIAQARATGINPEVTDRFDETLQYLKKTLTPAFVEARIPRAFTEETLHRELQERLTPAELEMAVNPIAGNPGISRWALQLTAGITNDVDKARAIFNGLIQRIQQDGGHGKRTAREVYAAWSDPDQTFSCQEFAKLYLALGRAVGLKVFYVHLGRDYRGKLVFHDCAIVFVEGKALLVDPTYEWFGVPHQEFTVLNDVQAVAHQLFQHGPLEYSVAKCRVAVKLHPDFAWGQIGLAGALAGEDLLEEAMKTLENAERLEPGRWDAYRLRGYMAVMAEDWNAALEHLNKALELNPENAQIHYLLGKVLTGQDREEEARESYRACLRYGPEEHVADQARRAIIQINERIGIQSDDEFGDEFEIASLLLAIEENKTETVRQMLAEGTDANTQENSGATALMMAAHQGNMDIVRLLLDHGADVNLKDNIRDYTALMVAAQEGFLDVVGLFLSAGADVNTARNSGETAMHAAAGSGHAQVIERLVVNGAEVNVSNSMGLTPLLLAAEGGHVEAVRVLIANGADLHISEKSMGATPLFIASQSGHPETVELLLTSGADVNAVTDNGMTALHIAAIKNSTNVIELLLHAGVDRHALATNPYGGKFTALECARHYGHAGIVELLQ